MRDVTIVGGGPVGLYAAVLLRLAGVDAQVLEQRTARSSHSRAIGIHPPALRALESAGIVEQLVHEGVQIREGVARSRNRSVATLSFRNIPGDYPFVLAIPQAQTERILEARLRALDPAALQRGIRVEALHDDGSHVLLRTSDGSTHRSRLVIGADGARSTIRDMAGIGATTRRYPDSYLMGDFPDTTGDGTTAALYLESGGIVESFPLPNGVRRWVVWTPSLVDSPSARALAGMIRERTGAVVDPAFNTMLSAFDVRRRIAERFVAGRTVLIGDAAHEVSPIGGQGMNLGWLDAVELAPIIRESLLERADVGAQLRSFNSRRRRAALAASRQAHVNMALGRPLPRCVLGTRNALLRRVLEIPATHAGIARAFTMQ